MDRYTESVIIVAENEAAKSLIRDSVHHTPNCAKAREQSSDPFVCFCDMYVHLADIILEAKNNG